MCHFISGFIINDFELTVLNKIGTHYALTFQNCNNEFVRKQLDTNQSYLVKNSKYCDCGTELGSFEKIQSLIEETQKPLSENELNNLRKKGWSNSKIQRWIDNKNKIKDRKQAKIDSFQVDEHPDTKKWIGFIQALFAKTAIKKFGIMLHWYKGGLGNEKIKILDKVNIKLKELDIQTLLKIQEDMIYYIER